MTPPAPARVRSETTPTPVVCAAFPRSGTQWLTRVLEDCYGDLVSAHHEPAVVSWEAGIHATRRIDHAPVLTDRRVVCVGGAALDLLDAYDRQGQDVGLVHVRRDPDDCARSCRRVLGLDYALALERWYAFDRAVKARDPAATFRIEKLWSGELEGFTEALGLPRRACSRWIGTAVDNRTPEDA